LYKIKSLLFKFFNTSKRYLELDQDIAIDKILKLFKDCSKYTIKIDAKRARKDFKVYCLTLESYVLSLKFSFKIIKISKLFKSLE